MASHLRPHWSPVGLISFRIVRYPGVSAIDPQKPIRISVQNGNVELAGVVDTQSDKDTAYIRANGVAGVFSVKNNLQVASSGTEKKQ